MDEKQFYKIPFRIRARGFQYVYGILWREDDRTSLHHTIMNARGQSGEAMYIDDAI